MSFVEESNTIPVRFPLLPRSRVRNELDSALYLTPWYKESERLGLGLPKSESDEPMESARSSVSRGDSPSRSPPNRSGSIVGAVGVNPSTAVPLSGAGAAGTSRIARTSIAAGSATATAPCSPDGRHMAEQCVPKTRRRSN